MKTLKKLSLALLVVVSVAWTVQAALTPPGHIEDSTTQGFAVKATVVEGVLMPVVDLPEVEIIGLRAGKIVAKGVLRNGKILIFSNLPEVEISASRINSGFSTLAPSGDQVMNNDLPVIEITADFPVQQLLEAKLAENSIIAEVDLPEFEVIYRFPQADHSTAVLEGRLVTTQYIGASTTANYTWRSLSERLYEIDKVSLSSGTLIVDGEERVFYYGN